MAIKIGLYKDQKLPSLDEMVEELKIPECGAVAIFQGKNVNLTL